jgi:hypothetical protein
MAAAENLIAAVRAHKAGGSARPMSLRFVIDRRGELPIRTLRTVLSPNGSADPASN